MELCENLKEREQMDNNESEGKASPGGKWGVAWLVTPMKERATTRRWLFTANFSWEHGTRRRRKTMMMTDDDKTEPGHM